MTHVGKELGFVAAGALQLLGTLLQLSLNTPEGGVALVQLVTLVGQRLRLFGELLVGLLQLGLLGFQVRLGLLEHARLLLQLLVGRAQFFLLGLQLFVELLSLAEHLLQTLAIARRFKCHADIAGDGLEELALTRLQYTHEGQFDHTVDAIFGLQRQQGNAHWLAFSETRSDLDVIRRQVIEADQTTAASSLSDQALTAVEMLLESDVLAEAITRNAREVASLSIAQIQGGDHAIEIFGKKLKGAVGQFLHLQLAE